MHGQALTSDQHAAALRTREAGNAAVLCTTAPTYVRIGEKERKGEREGGIRQSLQTEVAGWDSTTSGFGQGKHTMSQRVNTCSGFSNAMTTLLHDYFAHFPSTIV